MKKSIRAAIVLFCFVGAAYAADPNQYDNPTVGLKITKPADWQFATVQQHMDNLNRVYANDKQMQEALTKYATAPLAVIYKYPEPYPDLNPSFKINIRPLGPFKGKDSKEIIRAILPSFEKMFKDYALLGPVSDVTVSGLKGAYVRIGYTLEVPDGSSFPTVSELWIVPRGDFFFMMGAGIRKDEKTGSHAEIKKILDSVVIAH